MSECTKFADDLKAYVDGELSMLQKRAVQRHIAGCALCRDEVAGMTQIGKELRLGETFELDPALRARLLAAVPESTPTLPRRSAMPRRFSFAFAGSVAAMAALMVMFRSAYNSFSPVSGSEVNKSVANGPASSAATVSATPAAPPRVVHSGGKAKADKPADEPEDLVRQPVAPAANSAKSQISTRHEVAGRLKAPTLAQKDNQDSLKFAAPTVKDYDIARRDASAEVSKPSYRISGQTEEARYRRQANAQKPTGNYFSDQFNPSKAPANVNLNNQNLTPLQAQNSPGATNRGSSLAETATGGGATKSRGADAKVDALDARNHFYAQMGLGGGGGRGGGGFAGGAKGDAGPKGDAGGAGLGALGNTDFAASASGTVNGVAGQATLSSTTNEALSLRIEVSDIPLKRAAIDKIVKDANGRLTDLKDVKKSAAAFPEATFSVQVSEDNVKQVLGRLQQLGEVIDKPAPFSWDSVDKSIAKEQLDRRSTSNKLEETQEAKKVRKESTIQSRRAFDSNAGRTLSTMRPKEKDTETDRFYGAKRLYSTIIVNLRERKPVQVDSTKSKPTGAAAGQRKP